MAKQKTSSLLEASAALAESKSSTPVLNAVSEGFGKAIKMVEEEQQRIQDTVNDYMGDLKTDIDFTTLDPAMEKQVRNYLLDGKQEYSKMANELAKIKDASDPRYQELVDGMNEIQQGYSTLAGELTSYNQNKITTADQVRSGLFSKGTDQLGRITSVYGLDGTKPAISIDKGHLNFAIGGENIEYAKMKALPGIATEAAGTILDAQVEFSKRGTPITPQEKSRYARTIEDTLRDQNTLASILSDYPDELPLGDLQDKFFTLRKDGKLDAAALTDIRREVKDRILKGYEEASSIGVKAYEDKLKATGGGKSGTSSAEMQEKAAMWNAATTAYKNNLPFTIENIAGEIIRFAEPIKAPNGDIVYTKLVLDKENGVFIPAEAEQDFGKLGIGNKKQSAAKGTHAWTLPEIQAEFGYQF